MIIVLLKMSTETHIVSRPMTSSVSMFQDLIVFLRVPDTMTRCPRAHRKLLWSQVPVLRAPGPQHPAISSGAVLPKISQSDRGMYVSSPPSTSAAACSSPAFELQATRANFPLTSLSACCKKAVFVIPARCPRVLATGKSPDLQATSTVPTKQEPQTVPQQCLTSSS